MGGAFTGDTLDETVQLNARAMGRAQAYSEIAGLQFNDLYPESNSGTEEA